MVWPSGRLGRLRRFSCLWPSSRLGRLRRFHILLAVRTAVAIACGAALGGCSLGGADEEPRPARGAPKEVGAAVEALDRAARAGDWETVCRRLFTASARKRAGGRDCEKELRSAAQGVRRPRIELLAIEVRGRTARARVRTRAAGQAPVVEVIDLRRERGRYRIQALAG